MKFIKKQMNIGDDSLIFINNYFCLANLIFSVNSGTTLKRSPTSP
jgi:hypothetical protein